jgi:flagellar biogenesis protein FliO
MNSTFLYAVSIAVSAVTIYGLSRAFHADRRAGAGSAEDAPEIRVLSKERVARGSTLVIVEVEGRRLLLGVTRGQWTMLADLGAAPAPGDGDLFAPFDAELSRAMTATRYRRGWKRS